MCGAARRQALGQVRRTEAPVEGPRLSKRDGLVEEPDPGAGNEQPTGPGHTNSNGAMVQESNRDAQHVKRAGREDKPETVPNRISCRWELLAMRVAMEYGKNRHNDGCDPHW